MVNSYDPDDNDRLTTLGLLTVRAAKLEEDLRAAFCSLVGSKYAAVVAGGQPASWLIGQCRALVKANIEMTDDQKAVMNAALEECRTVSEQRNTLVHGIKVSHASGDPMVTHRSRKGTFEPILESWTNEDLRAVVSQMSAARFALHDAIREALPDEAILIELTLRGGTHRRRISSDEVSE